MAETDWITSRRPTEADGDRDGDVRVRYSPGSDDSCYIHWSHLGDGAPWTHCASWQPPAPEPAPVLTKIVLAIGQRWRRRDGKVVTIEAKNGSAFRAAGWSYAPDGTAQFPLTGPKPQYDLIELISEPQPEPKPRKFVAISRTVYEFGHMIDAIDEDGTAWWMLRGVGDAPDVEWTQLTPLPAREVLADA